jgi:hypothetical protein
MARRYICTFEQVSVSVAQDLVQISGAAGVQGKIIRAWVGCTDTTLPGSQMIAVRCRVLPTAVTNGTGGTAGTVSRTDPTDAAATVTALINNTTKATTSGTAVVEDEQGVHLYNGYQSPLDWQDPRSSAAPIIRSTSAFVLELLGAPAAALHLSGGVEIEETGA